jgi:hypothetical protein
MQICYKASSEPKSAIQAVPSYRPNIISSQISTDFFMLFDIYSMIFLTYKGPIVPFVTKYRTFLLSTISFFSCSVLLLTFWFQGAFTQLLMISRSNHVSINC